MTWPDAFAIAAIAACITAFAMWRTRQRRRTRRQLFEDVQRRFAERRQQ